MSTHLLSPAMAGLLDRIERAGRRPFHTMTPAAARKAYTLSAEILDLPRAPLPRVEALAIPAADGTLLPARLYAASVDPHQPVLLYLHGGGFVIGNLETHDSLCRQLALRSGGAVVALDYRLAPEHRFPVAVDDSRDALRWLHRHAAAWGLDPARIAIGGDSAGGTLAAAGALWARDEGLPLALQLLITPGTTAYCDTPSHTLFARGFLLESAGIAWFFDHYIDHADRADWRFAPLRAPRVAGTAPACVVVAECDPLADEGVAYAERLRAEGVASELAFYRGLTHDFIKLGRMIKEAHHAMDTAANALRRAWDTA